MANSNSKRESIPRLLIILTIVSEYLISCAIYDMEYTSKQNQTALNRLQDNCFCDITKNSCDPYCCCDPDCKSYKDLLRSWDTNNLCYSPPLTNLERYLKFCYRNSTALLTDLESPLNSLWRILRSGFCLLKAGLEQIGYSDGITTKVSNLTEYNNLLSEYSDTLNRSDITFNRVPNSFSYTVPKLYKLNVLPQFLTSISDYLKLISDVQKLKFYFDNINNLDFNWTDPLIKTNDLNSNFTLANFTSADIANVASKLNLSVFQGYKIEEPLAGFYQLPNSSNYESTVLNLPSASPNGDCLRNSSMIKYLKNEKLTCSNKLVLEKSKCLNYNAINNFYISNLNLYSGVDPTSNTLKVITQNIKFKKIINRFYSINQEVTNYTELSNFTNPINSTACGCSNIITEINHNFYVNKSAIVENEVIYYLEDINDICGAVKRVPLSYKISFIGYNKTYNYTKSGNPGYRKNMPLVLGQQTNYLKFNNLTGLNETFPYIKQFKKSPLLFGTSLNKEQNTHSICLYSQNISNSYQDSLYANKPFYNFDLIKTDNNTKDNFSLYKDPFLNNEIEFLDKSSWGCKDVFSHLDLKKFCLNQDWKKKLIYQNLKNITHIGQFGNVNRHLISDWIKIDKLDLNSYLSSWDEFYNRCSIPARINLNIFYATYGLVNNTQVGIFKASLNIENIFWWSKHPENPTEGQEFLTYINVNFYRIPQSTVWWFAPAPGFVKLPRNIMYPFRIGTTVYNKAGYIKNDHINLLKKFANVKQIPMNIKSNLSSFFLIIFILGALFF